MEKNKDLQTAFDNLVKATKEFQNLLSGEEVDISIDGENILEVYIDRDSETNEPCTHTWYCKRILDKLNIKY